MNDTKFKDFQQELKQLLDKYNITFGLEGYDDEAYINIFNKNTYELIKEGLAVNENNILE